VTPEELLVFYGNVVDAADLKVTRAREFAAFVTVRPELGVTLVESRCCERAESLVVEMRVPVGQQPKNRILRRERLLIAFDPANVSWPTVYPLRDDFPAVVPHLNIPEHGFPPTICVSELAYREVRREWSPPFYIGLLRGWLERTAKGDLHGADQPVEPFLLHPFGTLIVSHRLLSAAVVPDEHYFVRHVVDGMYRMVRDDEDVSGLRRVALLLVTTPVLVHGRIPSVPENLADLARMIDVEQFSLVARVKEHLIAWRHDREMLQALPLLLLQVPIARAAGATAERYELYAFLALDSSVRTMGVAFDMWDQDMPSAAILFPDPTRDGSGVKLFILNVQKTLSNADAAAYNGEAVSQVRFVAIGAGALGSQVLGNLARSGWTPKAVVDEDHALPHNPARHLLFRDAVGTRKVESVVAMIESVVDEPSSTKAIFRDVLVACDAADAELVDVDVVFDMSASVAAARRLAVDVGGSARRMSLYLNPTGTDSVLLAEDAARSIRLDQLELQYYWAVASRDDLAGHLTAAKALRYGGGCRDISSRIKQTSLAVHGGIGAEAFRRAVDSGAARATVWRLNEATGEVARVVVDATPMRAVAVSGWTVLVSEALLTEIALRRSLVLPSETGGVLMGSVDMERRIAYLVGSVPPPPDSKGWAAGYVRGSYGLQRTIATLCENAGGHLKYMGEWHSHPNGATTETSDDDKNAYRWFADALADEGRPPIMLIIGENDVRCVIDLAEGLLGPTA